MLSNNITPPRRGQQPCLAITSLTIIKKLRTHVQILHDYHTSATITVMIVSTSRFSMLNNYQLHLLHGCWQYSSIVNFGVPNSVLQLSFRRDKTFTRTVGAINLDLYLYHSTCDGSLSLSLSLPASLDIYGNVKVKLL